MLPEIYVWIYMYKLEHIYLYVWGEISFELSFDSSILPKIVYQSSIKMQLKINKYGI